MKRQLDANLVLKFEIRCSMQLTENIKLPPSYETMYARDNFVEKNTKIKYKHKLDAIRNYQNIKKIKFHL